MTQFLFIFFYYIFQDTMLFLTFVWPHGLGDKAHSLRLEISSKHY